MPLILILAVGFDEASWIFKADAVPWGSLILRRSANAPVYEKLLMLIPFKNSNNKGFDSFGRAIFKSDLG